MDIKESQNTRKAKINRNKDFPYKYRKICIICGKTYGLDKLTPNENGRCPNCYFGSKSRWRKKE